MMFTNANVYYYKLHWSSIQYIMLICFTIVWMIDESCLLCLICYILGFATEEIHYFFLFSTYCFDVQHHLYLHHLFLNMLKQTK